MTITEDVTAQVAEADAKSASTAGPWADPGYQADKHKLQVLTLTWEDTGRFKNSAVGPNISDMTIQVQQTKPGTNEVHLANMPVIRHDNFIPNDTVKSQMLYERIYAEVTRRVTAPTTAELAARRNATMKRYIDRLKRETQVRYEPGYAPGP